MGAGLSGNTGPDQPPDFTLNVVLRESIPVREILAAVQATGQAVSDVYSSQVSQRQIVLNQGESPLMRAGQAARGVLFGELAKCGPHLPILSRGCSLAAAATRGKLASFWLVDPLGRPDDSATAVKEDLCISVALVHNNAVVLGVVHPMSTGEVAWAVQGHGAWRLDTEGAQTRLDCSQFSLNDPGLQIVSVSRGKEVDELAALFPNAVVAQVASGPLGLLQVAAGKAHVYAGFGPVGEWEVAAADIIIHEAGGVVVNAGASSEDWKDAVVREQPLVYNTDDLRVPRLVAFGRRRDEESESLMSLVNSLFGRR